MELLLNFARSHCTKMVTDTERNLNVQPVAKGLEQRIVMSRTLGAKSGGSQLLKQRCNLRGPVYLNEATPDGVLVNSNVPCLINRSSRSITMEARPSLSSKLRSETDFVHSPVLTLTSRSGIASLPTVCAGFSVAGLCCLTQAGTVASRLFRLCATGLPVRPSPAPRCRSSYTAKGVSGAVSYVPYALHAGDARTFILGHGIENRNACL